jgi:hypothetical protein
MKMKKTLLTSTLLLCATMPAGITNAQDNSEYERWRAATQQSFQTYLDDNDKAFIGFLKQRWEEVETETGKNEDTAPKPLDIPVAPPVIAPVIISTPATQPKPLPDKPDPSSSPVISVITPNPQPIVIPAAPPIIPPAGPSTDVNFYGYRLAIPYNQAMTTSFRQRPSPESIADGWERLAKSDYKPTLEQLKQWQSSLHLSDWAAAQLVAEFSSKIATTDNARTLLSWFLMVKLGYDARLAYNDDLYLLMPADDDIFGVTFFTLLGQRYYALPTNGPVSVSTTVFTYGKQHESASDILKFKTPEGFIASGQEGKRTLTYQQDNKDVSVVLSYPAEQIRYLSTLPQLGLSRYPTATLPASTREQITQQLRPLLDGQSEEIAVNRLLNFVQNAFKYETDEEQFREENYLFPLETLHYAASDCEDRAALFSQLVNDLLGLPVVLLDYPGHIAAAVAFSRDVDGDVFMHNGRRYTVTDPTYINAKAGMAMPNFAATPPDVIDIF